MLNEIINNISIKPYFKANNFVLYLADSLNLLSNMPQNSIDMIFADHKKILR